MTGAIHRVTIKYKAEPFAMDCEEVLSFSTEAVARAYAERASGLPQVENARYMGSK